ncbi:hypothetical protein CCR75_003527 [Bremia lactucae]|uniref:Intron-binding protein aquarius n=1 Tax=Bremia lactucae TaxID=4779 RepID=A0A976IGJ8_BRELC|nr:hypothetical protein CCR75_003527 [Bremia lactucae]
MPCQAVSSSQGGETSAPTAHELAKTILKQSPSKETLDAVVALYVNFLDDSSNDDRTLHSLQELDTLQYLDHALWPLVDVVATAHHPVKKAWLVSVLLLAGFRAREKNAESNVWSLFGKKVEAWKTCMTTLWSTLAEAANGAMWTYKEQTALTQFLILGFQRLDVPFVAASLLQLTSLSLWSALSSSQRELEFQMYPKFKRHWNQMMTANSSVKTVTKKTQSKNKRHKVELTTKEPFQYEQMALVNQLDVFLQVLKAPRNSDVSELVVSQQMRFVVAFIALLIDLLSQLPTRRFLLTVLRRRHVRAALKNSPLVQHAVEGWRVNDRQAFKEQTALLDTCMRFSIDAHTGLSLSRQDQRERQTRHIQSLQQIAFQSFKNSPAEELAIAPCSQIANAYNFSELLNAIASADRSQLNSLAIAVGVLSDQTEADSTSDADLIEYFKDEYSNQYMSDNDVFSSLKPIFPTEMEIWNDLLDRKIKAKARDSDKQPILSTSGIYSADNANISPVLPVRKLGLQFLNFADYLLRNYQLLQNEAAQIIRKDLEVAIKQLDAVRTLHSTSFNSTRFRGFSQFAVPLADPLQIVQVSKPALGSTFPASVLARVDVELSSGHKRKWFDSYQTKEVVCLVTIDATADEGVELLGFDQHLKETGSFPEDFGVMFVRMGEIVEIADSTGNAIDDETSVAKGNKRSLTLKLDGKQYKSDLEAGHLGAYEQVNVLIRLKPHKNNFKIVLDTIASVLRDANREELLPEWLHDLFLGYGDPAAAAYKSIYKSRAEKNVAIPLGELLQDGDHALEAGGVEKLVNINDDTHELCSKDAMAPFTYVEDLRTGLSCIRAYDRKSLLSSFQHFSPPLRYTKSQVAAVRTAQCEGLTLIVGPPGTGKTDVAVQLVLNLYRTTPFREKILVVTSSEQALNDFFARILSYNVINEAEIVRMKQELPITAKTIDGHEKSDLNFAKLTCEGRVAFLMERRAVLLAEVEQMAQWLLKRDATRYAGLAGGSASYSCENALIFYQFHMKPILDIATKATELTSKSDSVTAFLEFFTMRKRAVPDKIDALRQFVMDIESYFAELRRLQPIELLQKSRQRGEMYLVHHARIIAMTCTDAASNHCKIRKLGLAFGSLIIEEAAQVSELNSLVPLLMACSSKVEPKANKAYESTRLKRVVLLGDPKQLPPVVRTMALKMYAHFDQSLFTRLLRLGVPYIALDYQGRSRKELVDIYRWQYDEILSSENTATLGDFHRVKINPEYQTGNAGFACVAQFIDLTATCHERQIEPFAYENKEEACFIVALFRYMIGIGYRSDQVTILTTYQAQKKLLKQLLQLHVPSAAIMCKVLSLDRSQGQHNDFILLSMVRSKPCLEGFQDVRLASTAFSCARLGLYVVGCRAMLERSRELKLLFSNLLSIAEKCDDGKATKLALVPVERVGAAASAVKKRQAKESNIVYVSNYQQLEEVVAGLQN